MSAKHLWNNGLRPDPAGGSARINRAILLCNLGVLLVNFFLAFKSSDTQIGLLRATSDISGSRIIAGARVSDVAVPYTRVLQALGSAAPGEGPSLFTADRLQVIYEAVSRYRSTIERGVSALMHAPPDADLRRACAELDKAAREEVEMVLGARFSDAALVQRLATEVIRGCR
jgi:hypothetical protein